LPTSNPYKKAGLKNAQCPPLGDIYYNLFGDKTDGTFVEVGAFNGVNWSATNCLARIGWSGLLFEPQTKYFNECSRLYKSKPNVVVERCAILDYCGETKLYLGGSLSTTSEERVKVYQDVWWAKSSRLDLEKFEEVPVYTLAHMLDKHTIKPDFEILVIDVEGAEVQVLNGINWDRWRPQLMMIETHEELEDERLSATAKGVEEIVFEFGYKKVFSNYINTVYIKE
jgi:FkbM family methyltransferase